jgi:peptide/nickel transport system substrate-binding protein
VTVAVTGGGAADTLNPYTFFTLTSAFGVAQLYDGLFAFNADMLPEPRLAEELESNKDGTQWTIRLRQGVEFHDGRPFTSADVLASFRRMAKGSTTSSTVGAFDTAGAKALDAHTVLLPTHSPLFSMPETLANNLLRITPADWNPAHPVGAGPFRYKSFTPGRQMFFDRNPNYWQTGKPYLDSIVIIDFADESSQVSALQSGAVNAATSFSIASAKVLEAGGVKLCTGPSGQCNDFCMNCKVAPFSDVRVRQAMRLVVDRPEMLSSVFGAYGTIANDTWCTPYDPLYVALPQRQQDREQAKSLLRQAGHSNLTVKLVTAPAAQGVPEMAQVFAQQAKGAGVNVIVDPVPIDVLYGPQFLKWPFEVDYNNDDTYLPEMAGIMLPTSSFNETNFNNPRFNSLYNQANAAADLSLRREIAGEMQRIEYDEGGYILPVHPPVLDAHAASVKGLQPGRSGLSFNSYDFTGAWLD